MKNLFFVFGIFLLLFASASALEIDAPARMPAYAPFTIQISLPPTESFSSASVTFDGKFVATLYPNGICAVTPEYSPYIIHCSTVDLDLQTTAGLTVVITHTGFAKGPHVIGVQTQGSQTETQSQNMVVFDAVDEQFVTDATAQLAEVKTQLQTADEKLNQTQTSAYENQTTQNQTIE